MSGRDWEEAGERLRKKVETRNVTSLIVLLCHLFIGSPKSSELRLTREKVNSIGGFEMLDGLSLPYRTSGMR